MKKQFFFLAVVLFAMLSFTKINNPENDIIGTWKFDEAYVEKVAQSSINAAKKNNPEAAAQLEQNYAMLLQLTANTEQVYKADHTHETKVPGQPIRNGKWEIVDNGHSLLLSPSGKPQRKDSILELSSTRMMIIRPNRDTILYLRQ